MERIENDIQQCETFLRAIAHFKSNAYAMEFWNEKLAHRFPMYIWNGRFLQKIKNIELDTKGESKNVIRSTS